MDDLAVVLASRVPIVAVETHEERRFLDKLRARCREGEAAFARPLFSWTLTDGLRRLDRDLGAQQHNADPAKVLQHIRAVDGPGIYVLLDFHPFLAEPLHQRLLKDIAVDARDGRLVGAAFPLGKAHRDRVSEPHQLAGEQEGLHRSPGVDLAVRQDVEDRQRFPAHPLVFPR